MNAALKRTRQLLRRWRFSWHNRGFEPYETTLQVNGQAMQFLIADIIGKQWYADTSPRHDLELEFIERHMLRPGQHVVECGPHHGMFTVVFARAVGPTGAVTAIEASREGARICRHNAALNGLDNVSVLECAVSDRAGSLSTTGDSNLEVIATKMAVNTVPAKPLTELVTRPPDVIKIDIEGHEVQALRGMAPLLDMHHPHLIVEVHTDMLLRQGLRPRDVLAFMDPAHYDIHVQWRPDTAPQTWDDSREITERVHLFAVRRAAPSSAGTLA